MTEQLNNRHHLWSLLILSNFQHSSFHPDCKLRGWRGSPPASYMLGMPTTEDKATEASGKQRKTPKSKNVIVGLSVTSSLYIGTESPPGARWPQGAPHPQPCDPHTAVWGGKTQSHCGGKETEAQVALETWFHVAFSTANRQSPSPSLTDLPQRWSSSSLHACQMGIWPQQDCDPVTNGDPNPSRTVI